MTTWAYDGRLLAADTCQTCDGVRLLGAQAKLYALPGHPCSFLVGAGERGAIQAVYDWKRTKVHTRPKLNDTDFCGLLVKSDRSAERYDYTLVPFAAPTPTAGGSGWQLALGAMLAGASALEALTIACRHDVWSARPIDCADIGTGIIVRHP